MSDRSRRERQKTNALNWAKQQERSFESQIKLPEGVVQYKLDKVGVYRIDVMPYIVGKNNPRAQEGDIHFEREYEAHRIPTPDGNRMFCCRMKCFGKKCAACDFLRMQGGTADQNLVKSLRTTTRHLWVVNDKPGDSANPLKVFDTNHYNRGLGFGEMLAEAITSVADYASFFELDGGYTLQLSVKEQTWPGGKFNAATRIDFLPRKYTYKDKMLDSAPCLDALLVDPGYDHVAKLLNPDTQGGEEEERDTARTSSQPDDDDDTPPPKKRPPADDDDDDESENKDPTAADLGLEIGDKVKHEEYGVCKIIHVSGDGTSLRIKDKEGDVHKAIAPSEVKKLKDEPAKKPPPADDDDDEPTPPPKKRPPVADDDDDDVPPPKPKGKQPTPKKEEPDDDQDDDDDDELPVRKPIKKTGKDVAFDDDDDDDVPVRKPRGK